MSKPSESSVTAYLDGQGQTPRFCASLESEGLRPFRIHYLAEGAANIVCRIAPEGEHELPVQLDGLLLRLRKNIADLSSMRQQHEAWQRRISKQIEVSHLVESQLVQVDAALLRRINETIPFRRNDEVDVREPHGLLITDMSPDVRRGELLWELKPKWLAQSPTAPEGSKRCRTCALRAQRRKRSLSDWCPLALVSHNESVRRETARLVIPGDHGPTHHYLSGDLLPLLQQIRAIQIRLDTVGAFAANQSQGGAKGDIDDKIAQAMTFRDCTLYIRHSPRTGFEARLGDLDIKSADRVPKWAQMEQSLIQGGWYANTEEDGWIQERVCLLSTRPDATDSA